MVQDHRKITAKGKATQRKSMTNGTLPMAAQINRTEQASHSTTLNSAPREIPTIQIKESAVRTL
jgi:hypothetical protein